MTAAIVVNDRLAQPATQGKAAVNGSLAPAEELRNLTALAQAAVGFDAARGDLLTVEDLAFEENRPQPPVSLPGQVLATAEELAGVGQVCRAFWPACWWWWPSGCAPRCATPGSRLAGRGAVRELPGRATAAPAAFKPPEPVEVDPERIRTQEIFEQVTGHLKREPTQSSRLLQSWIHSD